MPCEQDIFFLSTETYNCSSVARNGTTQEGLLVLSSADCLRRCLDGYLTPPIQHPDPKHNHADPLSAIRVWGQVSTSRIAMPGVPKLSALGEKVNTVFDCWEREA